MPKQPVLVIAVCCLLSAAVAGASGDGRAVRVDTSAQPDSVTVGQRVSVGYTITYPDSLTLLPMEEFDTGNCRLVSIGWRETTGRGQRVKNADLVVMPLSLDSAQLPPVRFLFLQPSGDTLVARSETVDIPIRLLTTAESEPKPLKPQWRAPRSYLWYYVAGGALLLAAVAVWWWMRRRKRAPVIVPVEPELPADYVALKALAEIETMDLLASGQVKKYYTLVVDVMRHYLERRYGIQAMDRTTDEILFDLDHRPLRVDGLESMLREADLVKFAKHKPDATESKRMIDSARDIVVTTTPRPVAVAGGE